MKIRIAPFEVVIAVKGHLDNKWKTTAEITRELKDPEVPHYYVMDALRILKYAGIADFKLNIMQNGAQSPKWKAKNSVTN